MIECEYCGSTEWCLRFEGEWVCHECFISEDLGDSDEWYELNEEAKEKRTKKRIEEWEEDADIL